MVFVEKTLVNENQIFLLLMTVFEEKVVCFVLSPPFPKSNNDKFEWVFLYTDFWEPQNDVSCHPGGDLFFGGRGFPPQGMLFWGLLASIILPNWTLW